METSASAPQPRLTWRVVMGATVLVHALVLLFLYTWPVYRPDVSTISYYFDLSTYMLEGHAPYRDFVFEYPPLAVPLFFLPRLAAETLERYRLHYALEQALLGLALAGLTVAFTRRHYAGRGLGGVLIAQPLAVLAAGVMLTLERYDLAPILATLAALYVWPQRQGLFTWVLLAVGTALKVYPVLLAPLYALEHARRREWGALGRNVGLYAVTLLLAFLPYLATGPTVLQVLFAYHGDRGLEINSLWATPLLVMHTRGAPLRIIQAHAAEEVVAPGAAALSALAVPTMAALLLGVYWLYWRERSQAATARGDTDGVELARLARFSAAVILAFVLPNKVLSPQYLLWPLPFLTLMRSQDREAVWVLYVAALALTQYVYPHHWVDLTRFLDREPILAVAMRNLLLLPLFAVTLLTDEKVDRSANVETVISARGAQGEPRVG